ncbi:hypothetical protein [Roseomonas xinghualingensis]|uniref:hypothetical protein n=1 Tax=Roseomonas xinghualingensis TaxID=2986475 RepID=UPI0021F212D3|nr:hypothetical protein [Roseomonas sp. SXEYE001]MCV4210064.1 hypothetical protein [Roseomonas sp. SXEYE001]
MIHAILNKNDKTDNVGEGNVMPDRHDLIELVVEVFQSGIYALLQRYPDMDDRREVLDRLRKAMSEVLTAEPVASDPVLTMKLRTVIAAGFEASIREAEAAAGGLNSEVSRSTSTVHCSYNEKGEGRRDILTKG